MVQALSAVESDSNKRTFAIDVTCERNKRGKQIGGQKEGRRRRWSDEGGQEEKKVGKKEGKGKEGLWQEERGGRLFWFHRVTLSPQC